MLLPLCYVETRFKDACHLNKQLKNHSSPRDRQDPAGHISQILDVPHTDDNAAQKGKAVGSLLEGSPPRAAPPAHSLSSRSSCWISGQRQHAQRAQTAAQPRCSRTEYRPCASAATKGTLTGNPRSLRWPLQANGKKRNS